MLFVCGNGLSIEMLYTVSKVMPFFNYIPLVMIIMYTVPHSYILAL